MRKTWLAAAAALTVAPVPAFADAPLAACRFDEMQDGHASGGEPRSTDAAEPICE